MKDIKKALCLMFTDRKGDVELHISKSNKTYIEYDKKRRKLYNQIMNLLPEEHKNLLLQYEDNSTLQNLVTERAMYDQGVKDGIKLKKIYIRHSK